MPCGKLCHPCQGAFIWKYCPGVLASHLQQPGQLNDRTEMSAPTMTFSRRFDQSLPIALLRAREASTRLFKPHIDRYDLTMPQWRVIRALAEDGPLDAKTVAERCVILPPSLTRIFRALTARGLTRAVETADARRHMLELTDAGRAIHRTVVEASEVTYVQLEGAFGRERMQTLLGLLNELRDTASAMPSAECGGQPDAADVPRAAVSR